MLSRLGLGDAADVARRLRDPHQAGFVSPVAQHPIFVRPPTWHSHERQKAAMVQTAKAARSPNVRLHASGEPLSPHGGTRTAAAEEAQILASLGIMSTTVPQPGPLADFAVAAAASEAKRAALAGRGGVDADIHAAAQYVAAESARAAASDRQAVAQASLSAAAAAHFAAQFEHQEYGAQSQETQQISASAAQQSGGFQRQQQWSPQQQQQLWGSPQQVGGAQQWQQQQQSPYAQFSQPQAQPDWGQPTDASVAMVRAQAVLVQQQAALIAAQQAALASTPGNSSSGGAHSSPRVGGRGGPAPRDAVESLSRAIDAEKAALASEQAALSPPQVTTYRDLVRAQPFSPSRASMGRSSGAPMVHAQTWLQPQLARGGGGPAPVTRTRA